MITLKDLPEILRLHKLWLEGDVNGKRADLAGANLSGAYLSRTYLAPAVSPYQWAAGNDCPMRTINNRTLVLGSRTINLPHMNGPAYTVGQLYVAPVFSRDPTTDCHPGLYIAGGPTSIIPDHNRLLIAFWLDEMIVTAKCRVPRFHTVANEDEFNHLTASDLEEVK